MTRPCRHPDDQLPEQGQPYQPGACRICWLAANDERYRNVWAETPQAERHQGEPPAEAKQLRRVPRRAGGCGCRKRQTPARRPGEMILHAIDRLGEHVHTQPVSGPPVAELSPTNPKEIMGQPTM